MRPKYGCNSTRVLLALGDLEGLPYSRIKDIISDGWEIPEEELDKYTMLIAYEAYADYSASAFYLLSDGEDLFEVWGSHCSCNGFEGQWKPERTSVDALKLRLKGKGYFISEWDDMDDRWTTRLNNFIRSLS